MYSGRRSWSTASSWRGSRGEGRWIVRRILAVLIGGLLLAVVSVPGAWAFGVKDVVAMHKDGVDDSLIVQKIAYSGTRFHLNPKDIGVLRSAGVSDFVISKMLKTEGRGYTGPYAYSYWGPYHYPHYGSFYVPYYGSYYPRFSVGLRYGYYGGYRGGFRHWRRF